VNTNWIESEYNPKADGNCGFRALAHFIFGDQERFGDIKKQMLDQLLGNKDWYIQNGVYEEKDVSRMIKILEMRKENVSTEYWFYTPDCCQLAADTYITPLHFHSIHGAQLYLPMTNTTYTSYKPIPLHLAASHITLLVYRRGVRLTHPPIYYAYENVCQKGNINSQLHHFVKNQKK
jgi:hypothetical protein